MSSLPPFPNKIKTQSFSRKGITMHDPAAGSIGAQTPAEELKDASKTSLETDPIMGGALPQNRIGRYGQ